MGSAVCFCAGLSLFGLWGEGIGWDGMVGGLSWGKTVGSVGGGEVVEVRERWGGMMCEGMGYEGWNG